MQLVYTTTGKSKYVQTIIGDFAYIGHLTMLGCNVPVKVLNSDHSVSPFRFMESLTMVMDNGAMNSREIVSFLGDLKPRFIHHRALSVGDEAKDRGVEVDCCGYNFPKTVVPCRRLNSLHSFFLTDPNRKSIVNFDCSNLTFRNLRYLGIGNCPEGLTFLAQKVSAVNPSHKFCHFFFINSRMK